MKTANYRPYPDPYDAPLGPAPLRVRASIRLERMRTGARRLALAFYRWFFDRIDWRRFDRLALECFSFLVAVLAVYVAGLVLDCAAIAYRTWAW